MRLHYLLLRRICNSVTSETCRPLIIYNYGFHYDDVRVPVNEWNKSFNFPCSLSVCVNGVLYTLCQWNLHTEVNKSLIVRWTWWRTKSMARKSNECLTDKLVCNTDTHIVSVLMLIRNGCRCSCKSFFIHHLNTFNVTVSSVVHAFNNKACGICF